MSRIEKLRTWLSAGALEEGAEVTRLMRRGQWIILFGFLGLGVWAAFAPVEGAVVANGVVTVTGQRKAVQHAEGGIVQAIHVRNGDVVKAGDVLLELKDLRTDAGVDLLDAQAAMQQATAARLRAERQLATRIVFPEALLQRSKESEVAAAMQREQQLFDMRRRSLNESLALLAVQERELAQRVVGLELQIKGESTARDLSRTELESYEKLAQTGYVSQSQLQAAQRRQSDYDVRLGEHGVGSAIGCRVAHAQRKFAQRLPRQGIRRTGPGGSATGRVARAPAPEQRRRATPAGDCAG